MKHKDVIQYEGKLGSYKSMVNITVVGVGAAGLSAIHYMKNLTLNASVYRAVELSSHTNIEPFDDIDLLLIISDIEDDEVANIVLSLAESSKKKSVLTLLVHIGTQDKADKESLVQLRLDQLTQSLASTIIINPECLPLSVTNKSHVSTEYERSEAYSQVVFALVSPLVASGYILSDLYHYHDVFSPTESKFGNICLFGSGRASGHNRVHLAVEDALKVISNDSSEICSAHAFIFMITASEKTLSMNDYERATEIVYPLINDDCYILSSMPFTEGIDAELHYYAIVCFHS